MLNEVIKFLPALGAVMAANICLGSYHNIRIIRESFDVSKFIDGIIKAFIIAVSLMATAYAMDALGGLLDSPTLEMTPIGIVVGGITLYLGKCVTQLVAILGISKTPSATTIQTQPTIETAPVVANLMQPDPEENV